MNTKAERAYRAAERQLWDQVGIVPTEHTVSLASWGTTVRVQEVGQGHPVLFVHGGPNTGSKWAPMLPRLSGFRCLLIDRPGTGLSEPLPRRLSPNDLLRFADGFVADALDALGVDRAHVVASSLGGFVALRSAAAHPGRIDRMVQMSCPALAEGMRTPPFLRAATLPLLGGLLRRMPPSRRGNVMAMRQMGHGATIDADAMPPGYDEWYLAMQRHTDTVVNDGRLIAEAATRRGFDERLRLRGDVLAAVQCPTRFIWGADDGFGGAEVGDRIVAHMQRAEMRVLEACGHLPWLDRPDLVAELVADWFDRPHAGAGGGEALNPELADTCSEPTADPVGSESVAAGRSVVTARSRRLRRATSIALGAALLATTSCGSDRVDADPPPDVSLPGSTTVPQAAAAPTTVPAATTTVPPAPTTTVPPASTTTVPSELTVTAVDFGFEGLPAELPAGDYTIHFDNEGDELHELLVYRNPDGLTPEEIHELGPTGAPDRIEIIGILFAEPGQPAPNPMVTSLTPGDYEVICFIPTPIDSRPHFAHGMHTEFTVVP